MAELTAPDPDSSLPHAGAPLACTVLSAALRHWGALTTAPEMERYPTVTALLQALSRQPDLSQTSREALQRLRPQVLKAVLALDAPSTGLRAAWRRIAGGLGMDALPAALRAADGVSEAGLRAGADLVEQLGTAAASWPKGRRAPDLDALARALAWGALRGSDLAGLNPEAVAAVAALRQLVDDLCQDSGSSASA